MHFVKKEHVDSDEKAAQERKRVAKLTAFTQARDRVFEKRKNGEYDEEIMTLTGELLNKNPDIYTLWNVRREAIDHFAQKPEENETDQEHNDRMAKIVDGELDLTQECLLRNPKSYSSWHHRFLMLQRHPKRTPSMLGKELAMCEKALAMDCRNFHCWDHRRSIARLANLSQAEELSFSDRLIGKNPSNYSAWHYRGTLLPSVFPNPELPGVLPISDECLAQEFEKVLHVCGVNSEDQTAWTYCRWLVEVASATPNLSTKPAVVVSARFVDSNTAHFVFSDAVNRETVTNLVRAGLGEDHPTLLIKSLSAFNVPTAVSGPWQCSHCWLISPLPSPLKFPAHPPADSAVAANCPQSPIEQIDNAGGHFVNVDWLEQHFSTSPSCTRAVPRKCLHDLVELCEQLIPEEDNPWELAALTRAKLALEGVNEQTLALARDNCEKLEKIDAQRAEMYEELMDRVRLVDALNGRCQQTEGGEKAEKKTHLGELLTSGGNGRLNLRGRALNSLLHLRPLSGIVCELNLEDNLLSDHRQIGQLASFSLLTHLTLDGNPIQRLPSLDLPLLNFLSLARTRIRRFDDIQTVRQLPSLERLILCETELASSQEEQRALREAVGKEGVVRLIFHWM